MALTSERDGILRAGCNPACPCRQQSQEMHNALQACDTPVSHVVYKTLSHVGFATEWPQRQPKVCMPASLPNARLLVLCVSPAAQRVL